MLKIQAKGISYNLYGYYIHAVFVDRIYDDLHAVLCGTVGPYNCLLL